MFKGFTGRAVEEVRGERRLLSRYGLSGERRITLIPTSPQGFGPPFLLCSERACKSSSC
jgi:hypothetical protein